MKKVVEVDQQICDDMNPISQVIQTKENQSKTAENKQKIFLGPKLEENVFFKLSDRVQNETDRTNIDLMIPLESSPKRANELFSIVKQAGTLLGGELWKKKCLSKFTKYRNTTYESSPRHKGQKALQKDILTLQELIFKQKLERFIRNIRSQCGLNDLSRLRVNQIKIINDKGASENEILKLNRQKDILRLKEDGLKREVKDLLFIGKFIFLREKKITLFFLNKIGFFNFRGLSAKKRD